MYRGSDSSRPFYECFAAVAVDRHHRCISEKSSEFHGVSDSFPSTGIILTAVVFWLIIPMAASSAIIPEMVLAGVVPGAPAFSSPISQRISATLSPIAGVGRGKGL